MQKEFIKLEHPKFKKPRYFATLTYLCDKLNEENGVTEENKLKGKKDIYLGYHSIKMEEFPFNHKGYIFSKIEIERKEKKKIEK
jgi:hypothetical protein